MANDNSHNAKQAEQLDTPIYREGSKKAQLVDRLRGVRLAAAYNARSSNGAAQGRSCGGEAAA